MSNLGDKMTSKEKFERTSDKKLREIKESFMGHYKNQMVQTSKPMSFDWSHLEDDRVEWLRQPCPHPEHNPPNMICLRPGQVLRHVCPACGKTRYIHGSTCFM